MNELSDFTKYLTDEELAKVAPMLERLKTLDNRTEKHDNFMSFVKHVWPQFIEGSLNGRFKDYSSNAHSGACCWFW